MRFDTTLMAVSTPIISSAVSAPYPWDKAAREFSLIKIITSVSAPTRDKKNPLTIQRRFFLNYGYNSVISMLVLSVKYQHIL